jgi:hypothetical protein
MMKPPTICTFLICFACASVLAQQKQSAKNNRVEKIQPTALADSVCQKNCKEACLTSRQASAATKKKPLKFLKNWSLSYSQALVTWAEPVPMRKWSR